MRPLADLRRSFDGPGRLDWIGLRPARKAQLVAVERATVTFDGLTDDHGRPGKRAVTLIQAEHLPVIAALVRRDSVPTDVLRRNLVISGINLTALREFGLRIGSVRLTVTAPCAPCSRMEMALGAGGYSALRGHGGWCCSVLQPGLIALGDAVVPDLD
ncbi:MOSC domain-containing protein [Antarctobacter heliothermus]|uniref:MOSC domain-containing protein YiiM n=1 Tax=Antarctobacter heliothermus TaxID=74033 RepID=A0A239D1W1_9RHOB|nr:MOSC domain-containing protein [Antarctobacter heliothermus]SNS25861.1 MOSC domain-containing protein YiiM [Antarctobacter heliothermus]